MTRTRPIALVGLLLLSFFVTACLGGSDGEPSMLDQIGQARDAVRAMEETSERLERYAQEQEDIVSIEPVDFRVLRELLPETLAGLPREQMSGERGGAMGISISKVEATYREEGDDWSRPRISVTLTDLGAMRGAALFGLAQWLMVEVDRESDTGYERTGSYEGHPSYEKYVSDGPNSEVQVLVSERFLVQVTGHSLEMDRLQSGLQQIDIGALEAMKDEGVTRADPSETE